MCYVLNEYMSQVYVSQQTPAPSSLHSEPNSSCRVINVQTARVGLKRITPIRTCFTTRTCAQCTLPVHFFFTQQFPSVGHVTGRRLCDPRHTTFPPVMCDNHKQKATGTLQPRVCVCMHAKVALFSKLHPLHPPPPPALPTTSTSSEQPPLYPQTR